MSRFDHTKFQVRKLLKDQQFNHLMMTTMYCRKNLRRIQIRIRILLLSDWKVLNITAKMTEKDCYVLKGIQVTSGGTELRFTYLLYGA